MYAIVHATNNQLNTNDIQTMPKHPYTIALLLILALNTAHADTVTLDGKRHTNVYVTPGTAFYYIRFAKDGVQISVPKEDLSERDIRISKNPEERKEISESWKTKRDAFPLNERNTMTYREWQKANRAPDITTPKAVIPPVQTPVIKLSNTSKNQSRSSGKAKIFMDSQGTRMLTNAPGQFQNNEEYVEIQLDYEPIDIPQKFKGRSTTKTPDSLETYDDIIAYYADYYSLDKSLIYAVIMQESNGNPYAVSSAGARGLMQLMPGTAAEMGVRDIFDPAQNIAGGTQYLSKMKKLFGNTTLALAGYNAGPGNVRKYGNKVPPFAETESYVRRVQQYQRQYQRYGVPTFDIASAKPVENEYLPPTTEKFYRIILENGLTVRADNILEDGNYYGYVFKGRSGRIKKQQVRTIYDPV